MWVEANGSVRAVSLANTLDEEQSSTGLRSEQLPLAGASGHEPMGSRVLIINKPRKRFQIERKTPNLDGTIGQFPRGGWRGCPILERAFGWWTAP